MGDGGWGIEREIGLDRLCQCSRLLLSENKMMALSPLMNSDDRQDHKTSVHMSVS